MSDAEADKKADEAERLVDASRLKMRGLKYKALDNPFLASCYYRAAAALDPNWVESRSLLVAAEWLEFTAMAKLKKEMAPMIEEARERLLEELEKSRK